MENKTTEKIEIVTINKERLRELIEAERTLDALNRAGVDNQDWYGDWYGDALSDAREKFGDNHFDISDDDLKNEIVV